MAAEQGEVGALTPQVHLYATAVLLFEALTGRLPFVGSMYEVLLAKHAQIATRASMLVDSVPADLDALCQQLLEREPARRPTAAEARALLGDCSGVTRPAQREARRAPFIGRQAELLILNETLAAARQAGPLLVLVEGESGIGKTALIGEFMARCRERSGDYHLLRGRCHPLEEVRFKAFDGVVEDMSRFL